MISDQTKVGLLAASLLGCLLTLFTSGSFHSGGRGVPTLTAPTRSMCKAAVHDAEECGWSGDSGNSASEDEKRDGGGADDSARCKKLVYTARLCERTVEKAYRHINLGGCAKKIQRLTVCNVEWCEDIPHTEEAREDCKKECGPVREELEKCQEEHVKQFLQRAGLGTDGTMKQTRV